MAPELIVATAAVAALLLTVAGFLLAMRTVGRNSASAGQMALDNLRDSLGEQIRHRDAQIAEIKAEAAAVLAAARHESGEQIAQLRQALDREGSEKARLAAELAALRAQNAEQVRAAGENLERFTAAREEMTNQFKAIAGDVLKSHGETFSKQNKEQVDLLLKPLGEKIVEFQAGMQKDRAELVEQVRQLHLSSLNMTQEATNLTRALKGNAQTQGAWGEMILTSILERSGLRKGEQFLVQETHEAEGGRVRTDVEILMPNGDKIVIDSKVSLNAFEAHVNSEDEDERAQHLRAHVSSVRGHIKTLRSKEYHRHAKSGLDFVLMFVPIEAAFVAAVSADGKLLDEAFGQNVFVTTPTTLMSTLRAIHNVWRIEDRQRNAEEIADRAGKLYEKVAGFLESMDKLDRALGKGREAFDTAKAQLSTGSGNVVRQIEQLKALGAKTNKTLPAEWEQPESRSTDTEAQKALFFASPAAEKLGTEPAPDGASAN